MPITNDYNIYYADGDTPLSIATISAEQAGSVDTALGNIDKYAGRSVQDSAERDSLYASPAQGDVVFRQDTGRVERYYDVYDSNSNPGGKSPAAWYPEPQVLTPVVPTTASVSGSQIEIKLDGTIILTGATSLTLLSVFSSAFTNYRVEFNLTSSTVATAVKYNLNTGGADYVTATHATVIDELVVTGAATGTNTYTYSNTSTFGTLCRSIGLGGTAGFMNLYNPYVAQSTALPSVSKYGASSSMSRTTQGYYSTYISATGAYESLTIAAITGTISGTIRIYGFN
jgi:hypothetical protein